ncbi:MAG: response regulator [Calditrichaeota bacterium]|nr:MAG: response regulator [Calditrichota bacterium]
MASKILIIEDDFDLVWMIRKLLDVKGYEVLTAVTAEQGIDQFSRHIFDIQLVLLDLTLPDMEGETVLQEIFKVRPEIPVIITTGSEDRSQQRRLEASGIYAYLVKPFDLTRLVELIEQRL